jgi:hypothetical protein
MDGKIIVFQIAVCFFRTLAFTYFMVLIQHVIANITIRYVCMLL